MKWNTRSTNRKIKLPRSWSIILLLIWCYLLLYNNQNRLRYQAQSFLLRLAPSQQQQRWITYTTKHDFILPLQKLHQQSTSTTEKESLPIIQNESEQKPLPQDKKEKKLQNVVCLVTGASRGIGKGIALELGAQGAIVYVTGTTTNSSLSLISSSNNNNNGISDVETIEQTALEINELGGIGIPLICDHSNDTDVLQNVIQVIEHQYGYLDILVNNAFRFPNYIPQDSSSTSSSSTDLNTNTVNSTMQFLLQRKFYEQGATAWDSIHTVGLRSHYITTCYAMKLLFNSRRRIMEKMQQQEQHVDDNNDVCIPRPIIVMISSFGGLTYSFNVAYGVGKAGVDRMVKDMAYEIQDDDICIVSLYPGLVNTERTQRSVRNGEWDKYVQLSLDLAETPQYTGRAIVAIATDRDNMRKAGTIQVVAECATEYQFTDINGTIPPSIRSLRFLLYNYLFQTNPVLQKLQLSPNIIPDIRIPLWMMAMGRPPSTK